MPVFYKRSSRTQQEEKMISPEIKHYDRLIDELYGLTEDESTVVEGKE